VQKRLYKLRSRVWLYPGSAAAWHFISLPAKESAAIKKQFGAVARGWGSLPVEATIGTTRWQTSIFPDKKSGTYLLPLKALVRQKEGIRDKDKVTFSIKIR
jgi:hypothetical protein